MTEQEAPEPLTAYTHVRYEHLTTCKKYGVGLGGGSRAGYPCTCGLDAALAAAPPAAPTSKVMYLTDAVGWQGPPAAPTSEQDRLVSAARRFDAFLQHELVMYSDEDSPGSLIDPEMRHRFDDEVDAFHAALSDAQAALERERAAHRESLRLAAERNGWTRDERDAERHDAERLAEALEAHTQVNDETTEHLWRTHVTEAPCDLCRALALHRNRKEKS
jgi:hypothetical protein